MTSSTHTPAGNALPAGVLLFAMLATAAIAQTAAAQTTGTVGIRLVEAPVSRSDDPRAHAYIIDHVSAGTAFSRKIAVSNSTDRALSVDLYPGAAQLVDGTFRTAQGRSRNQLTEWLSVEPSTVVVPAGGESEATVSLSVPDGAASGERYGVIWAEPPSAGSGVRIVNRVGIRVYLSVGGGTEPRTDFEVHSLTASRAPDGRPVVQATAENTGGRAIDLTGELLLSEGPGDLEAGPFPTEGMTTLGPGQSAPMVVELDPEIPAGPWLARMVARSGTLEKAVEATITFPEEAGESAEPVEAEEVPLHQDRGFLIPLAIGLTLLTLFLLLLFWWFFLRRRRDEEDRDADDAARRPTGVGN